MTTIKTGHVKNSWRKAVRNMNPEDLRKAYKELCFEKAKMTGQYTFYKDAINKKHIVAPNLAIVKFRIAALKTIAQQRGFNL